MIPHYENIMLGRKILFAELDEILKRLRLDHAYVAEISEFLDVPVQDGETLCCTVFHVVIPEVGTSA